MKLPPDYRDAHLALGKRYREREAKRESGRLSTPAAGRETIADFWRFYRRWHPLLGGTPQQKELDAMRVEFIRPLEAATEVAFLAMLNEALATHRRHVAVEEEFTAHTQLLAVMQQMPEGLIEDVARKTGKSLKFDPVAEYRAMEAKAAEAGKEARRAFKALMDEWPTRMTPALRARWKKLDAASAKEWMDDLAVQMDALKPAGAPEEPK